MKRKPNILLITCDQLRYDYVGAYGNSFISTPNIDRLAHDGCTFEHAYSPNPVCIPARYNMITGLPARYHGFDDNYFEEQAKVCPQQLPTFAQILSDNNYETVAIGKMHFQPTRRATGFDFFYSMEEIPNTRQEDDYAMYLKKVGYGNIQNIHGVRTCLYMQPQRSLIPEEHHGSNLVANRTIGYLEQSRRDKPFLLWAGFIQPHPPFDVPDAWADMYLGKTPPPTVTKTPLSVIAKEKQQLGCLSTEESITRMRELYAAAVSFADYQIGRILDKLDELNIAKDTLVIFTSDHGEMLGDLGTYQKFLPYEASCRIPLFLRYPGKVAPDSTDSRFVDLNDLLPTFIDVAGVSYPATYELPGESLFAKEGVKKRTLQYIEHQRDNKRWCSLRNEKFKYVYYYGDDDQMFDMTLDPQETTNLLYQCTDDNILKIRNDLRASLICYEQRYGLNNCVQNGDFISKSHYEGRPHFETNFPRFGKHLNLEEAKELNQYDDEILMAISKEPTVKLRQNHTKEILHGWGKYTEEQIENLLRRAEAQGN